MAKIYPLEMSIEAGKEQRELQTTSVNAEDFLAEPFTIVVGRFIAYERKGPGHYCSPSGMVLSCADVIYTGDGEKTNVYGKVEEDHLDPTGVYAVVSREG